MIDIKRAWLRGGIKMKQVLIYSIQPEHVLNFLNGKKTIEVRKRDLPQWAKDKIDRGEVVQGYGYCTMGKQALMDYTRHHVKMGVKSLELMANVYELQSSNFDYLYGDLLNGKVVVKFQVSGSDVIHAHHLINQSTYWYTLGDNSDNTELIEKSCVDMGVMLKYLGLNDGYAHHFTNIQPIEPMELGEFHYFNKEQFNHYNTCINENWDTKYLLQRTQLRKAPQSFQSAWVKGE